ncbi:glyoxalase [Methylocapsa sp. S129]|uniref:glyoxalase n=1 Tax=Methylocapsa sp. S129 TaxID=1641869 RepID=UPI00131C7156|nr:glyoxalase [Methylocapsa sp. S129]
MIAGEAPGLTVRQLRPFVPARDFSVSQKFYSALGFEVHPLGEGLAEIRLEQHAFLLQNYYVEQWAANFMMHVLVDDLQRWWWHIKELDLSSHFDVQAPSPPKLESWGLNVAYVSDPSGVLWHFAETPSKPIR